MSGYLHVRRHGFAFGIVVIVALLVVVAGCRRGSVRASPVTPPSPPPVAIAPDPRVSAHNLSFEVGDPPEGWTILGPHTLAATDGERAHHGQRSLRIQAAGSSETFSNVMRTLPIEDVRGKRVRYGAWLATESLDGQLGVWIRADGAMPGEVLAFAGSHAESVSGTATWTRREVVVEVPAEATSVMFGGFVSGAGTAWLDELSLVIEDPAAAPPIVLSGSVVDAAGAPVGGAVVAAVAASSLRPASIVRSDDAGRFRFALTAGTWALTATHEGGAAAYWASRRVDGDTETVLSLADGGFTVSGQARVVGASATSSAQVQATRFSEVEGDVFVTDVGADGRYRLRLPTARGYTLELVGDDLLAEPIAIARSEDQIVDLAATAAGPPPDEVVAWLAQAAVPVSTVEAGHGFDDLARFGAAVGDARIVALGEATHGTREFFQAKHRLLEYLVEEKGFRVFAIEANQPEARRVNDYVLRGEGDAKTALDGLYFWTWNTEEVLAMIEWMRAYNMDAAHTEKVQFAGVDMQTSRVAWADVVAYLEQVDPEHRKALPVALDVLGQDDAAAAWGVLARDERQARLAALASLFARFTTKRKAYERASSKEAWVTMQHDLRVVQQAAEMYEADARGDGFEARDRAMAENALWLLDQQGKRGKLVLWAHNGHIAYELGELANMGSLLAKQLGKLYLPLGFVFAEGAFQAMTSGGATFSLRESTLGPPADADVSTAFVRAGHPLAIVDLRTAPKGLVADWLAAPHPTRELGALFADEAGVTSLQRLSRRFAVVFFVAKTTRARPNYPLAP